MSIENRTFTLVGKFDDRITKGLKTVNKQLEGLSKFGKRSYNPFKGMEKGVNSLNSELKETQKSLKSIQGQLKQISKFKFKFDKSGIKAAQDEVKTLGRDIENVAKKGFQFDKSGIKAAQEEVKVLGREIDSVAKNGFNFDKSGIQAAQQEASVLGDILKANALVKAGEGVGNALTSGASSAVSVLRSGAGFVGKQFGDAVKDQMEDLQARGSLYGSLRKQGLLTGKTAEEQTQDYRQTKAISRANEQAIGQLIRTSSVSTGTVTTLNRQLTDNLLPTLLKAKGITNLSGKSREELDTVFGGKKGIGTDLARLYEQMATVMPSPSYAKMGAMGFTQAITSGTINKQLAIFESNPVLVEALKTIDGGIQGTADIGKRIQILRKALEVAAPTMMLDEMRNTIAGGMQAVQDTIMNPTVGILSLGADIANEGKKTLQQYKDSGAYQLKMERVKANILKSADKMELTGLKRKEYIAKQEKEAYSKLNDALESADSPIEKISVALAPLLQSFASLLNSFGNQFIGPVTNIMNSLYKPFAQLEVTFDRLVTDVEAGKRSVGEALGRAVGEFFKAIASYFNPEKAGEEIGEGIQKFFADFKKGFDSINGDKWVKMVVDSLKTILMNLVFNEGNVMKGFTPLADALGKVFLLLAAPAFIASLISGLLPLVIYGMGGMILGTLKGLTPKLIPALANKAAGGAGGMGGGSGVGGNKGRYGRGGSIDRLNRMRRYKMGQRVQFVGEAADLGYSAMGRPGSKTFGAMGKSMSGMGRGFGRAARMVPGGAMAAGAIDMGLALASGESFGKAAAGTIGTVLGGTLGSVFGPAGTLVGSMVGGMVGDKVGVALSVPSAIQYRAAELSKQASEQMLQAANLTKGSAEASFLFGSASSLSKRLDVEGLGGNKAAAAFQKEYAQREFFAKQAGSAADALNQTITNLKNQGLPPDTILKMVRPLQVQSDIAARNLADSNRKLKSSFDALPQQLQSALVSSISRMSTGMIEAAFANKITGLRFSADGLTFRGSGKVDDYTSGDPFKPAPKPAPQFNTGGVNTSGFVWRRAEGGLGDAVSKEMRMKPPGSNLVIANSSETIIPAAGGLGMRDFMNSLDQGFRKVSSLVSSTPYKVGLSTISSKSLTPPGWGSSPSAPMEVTNNITIHQQPGQDAEELAAIVAMRIGEVVAARKASQIM